MRLRLCARVRVEGEEQVRVRDTGSILSVRVKPQVEKCDDSAVVTIHTGHVEGCGPQLTRNGAQINSLLLFMRILERKWNTSIFRFNRKQKTISHTYSDQL